MADIQYWEDTLRDEIDEIHTLLDRAGNTDGAERASLLSQAEKKLRQAQGTKRSFKMEARLVSDPNQRRRFEERLGKLDEELQAATSDMRALKSETNRGELFVGAASGGAGNGANDEMDDEKKGDYMLNEAKHLQDKTQQSLDNTKRLVAESKEVGVSTLEELERQRQTIERVDAEVDRIEDNLARADKLIKHFGKRMASDKFIQCFAVINVLLLVGVILYAVFRGGSLTGSGGNGSPTNPLG